METKNIDEVLNNLESTVLKAQQIIIKKDRKQIFDIMNSGIDKHLDNNISKSNISLKTMTQEQVKLHIQGLRDSKNNMDNFIAGLDIVCKILEKVVDIAI